MRQLLHPIHSGQSLVEYGLIAALIALVALGALLLVGQSVSQTYDAAAAGLNGDEDETVAGIAGDFLERMQGYYDANGRWARSWGDDRFTQLGLDPAVWNEPVAGIYWNPNKEKIGLGNKPGDDLQIYVTDLDGRTRRLYDGWHVWCVTTDGKCYYHTVAPENEIDINSLVVVEQ
jgi:Flp pilus assembly pilin Flp